MKKQGYRTVATDGVDARLVDPGDVGQLAGALREVLGDSSLRAALVAAGARRAEAFSMRTLAERYIEIYREVLASARPVPPPQRPPWTRMMMSAFGRRDTVARSFTERRGS